MELYQPTYRNEHYRQHLPSLNTEINIPENHTYKNLGWVHDLGDTVNKYWRNYGEKVRRMKRTDKRTKKYQNTNKYSYIGLTSTLEYSSKNQFKNQSKQKHTIVAMQTAGIVPRFERDAVAIHEEAHVADHTGNRDALEKRFGLYLKGKPPEDMANLVMLSRMEEKGYDLEKRLYSSKNKSGMLVGDSSKTQKIGIQKAYHKYITTEYARQKRSRTLREKFRRKNRKSKK